MTLRKASLLSRIMPAREPFRLAMIARDPSDRVDQARQRLGDFLDRQTGIELTQFLSPDLIPSDLPQQDLVVVLGGDGTILRTCRQLGVNQMPMLGVNLGRLGFLADLSPKEFEETFPSLARKEFRVVHHLMLECRLIHTDGSSESFLGLNEAAVLTGAALRMVDIEMRIDGERVATYSCDGLIISTPVGSTAHSLAAGGPILRQDLQAFVITPISPHTLTNRPLVDSADCVYEMDLPFALEGVMLVVDGQIKRPLATGDRVEVRRAGVTFQLARLPGHSYYDTLHRKLSWGGGPNYEGTR
jgi:NAD+ kinase